MTLKVCLPMSNGQISRYFGKAQEFALATVSDGKIASAEVVPNPGRGLVRVPAFVAALGATHVIAAGIGNPAVAVLKEQGVEVYAGASGGVDAALRQFLRGELRDKRMSCAGENRCGAQHSK